MLATSSKSLSKNFPRRLSATLLANYQMAGYVLHGGDIPPDDFEKIAAKIRESNVAGLVFGTPVYFGTISALMKPLL